MRDTKPSGLQVINKDEKESRVIEFLEAYLAGRAAEDNNTPAEFLLVARSPESPVCLALATLASELRSQSVSVRMVLTAIDGNVALAGSESGLVETGSCRIISDVRLYEAHEQLVLDEQTCWVGDCMRREPARRDAYENYSTGCLETARSASATFKHLWSLGQPAAPVARLMPGIGFKDAHDAGLFSNSPADGDSAPTAATRH